MSGSSPRPKPLNGGDVRGFRKRLGWSQKRLAGALGIHTQTLSKWERGVQAIEHPVILRLALERIGITNDSLPPRDQT